MQIIRDYIKGFFLLLLVAFLYGFATLRNEGREIEEVRISFEDESTPFITRQAVNKLLIQNKVGVKNALKENIALNKMETVVSNHPIIKESQVFMGVHGDLNIALSQRKPIARCNSTESYYIDEYGKSMPLSSNYSARVPIIQGVAKKDIGQVYKLLDYLSNDMFFKEHIIGVQKKENNEYLLKPRVYSYGIELGDINNIHLKLTNYKAFYTKALADQTLANYKKIDLRFYNQVVCTPK